MSIFVPMNRFIAEIVKSQLPKLSGTKVIDDKRALNVCFDFCIFDIESRKVRAYFSGVASTYRIGNKLKYIYKNH